MNIKSIQSVPAGDLRGKKVLVRVDFNVPVTDEGTVRDDLRIRKTLPTIKYLREAGAKLILLSHIEGNNAKLTGGADTLEPVAQHIQKTYAGIFGNLTFVKDFLGESGVVTVDDMQDGDVVLFENVRTQAGEKKNDIELAKKLAAYGEIYVNDAFAVSHRAHASVVALPSLFPEARYAGIQLASEIEHLSKVFNPSHPFVFILGGAKFDTKIPLIEKYMAEGKADFVILGGALLNDILKAKGYEVGKSLVSNLSGVNFDMNAIISNPKLIIPDDVVVKNQTTGETSTKKLADVSADDSVLDVGPSIVGKIQEILKTAQFVLWNGPMGDYERGFKDQTISIAKEVSASRVQSAVGGGDTTAALAELNLDSDESGVMFISTGGGAMLEYLQNETLPGIDALK